MTKGDWLGLAILVIVFLTVFGWAVWFGGWLR